MGRDGIAVVEIDFPIFFSFSLFLFLSSFSPLFISFSVFFFFFSSFHIFFSFSSSLLSSFCIL